MRCEIAIKSPTFDRGRCGVAVLQFGDVIGWRNSANYPIGAVRKGCLVDDGIIDRRFDALPLAPILRKEVMNIDVFAKENGMVEFLARSKVLCALLHQQGIDTLISG